MHCHLLLLGDLAARRAGAAVLPCALGTAASLADVSPSRVHALSAWHEEAALGCALVAADYGAIRHPYAPFLLFQWVVTPAHMMPPNEVPRSFSIRSR